METMTDQETSDSYNGWTNRETWAVNLHLSNDEGFYNDVLELVKRSADPDELEGRSREGWLADEIKDYVEDLFDEHADVEGIKGMRNDVGSMWRVDWYEVAAGWISEASDQ